MGWDEPVAELLAIEAQDVVKTGPAGVRVLDGLSLGVAVGAVCAVLGPAGAGKSTAVGVLAGLVTADGGRAWVAGHAVRRAPEAVRRRTGHLVRRWADPHGCVREELRLAGREHGLSGEVLDARVETVLGRFDLVGCAERPVGACPVSRRRSLDLACAVIHDPPVLLLDEPTAGLDPGSRADLWEQLDRLCREDGRTVLLATADAAEADRLATQVAVLRAGRVLATRPAAQRVG